MDCEAIRRYRWLSLSKPQLIKIEILLNMGLRQAQPPVCRLGSRKRFFAVAFARKEFSVLIFSFFFIKKKEHYQ
jgi:hypothetical protein